MGTNAKGVTTFKRKHQFKKFIQRLTLTFGLAHYTKHIDRNGDGNCPLNEMQFNEDWKMDTTFKFTRIAKNLGYRDQWKLRRIYNAIASSTEYEWADGKSGYDTKLCKNRAVPMAATVAKIIPVYYDYMHNQPVDYCWSCP